MQSQQMEKELSEQESTYLKELLKSMLEKNLLGEHSDHVTSRCNHCQKMSVFYYQITILVDCALPKEVDGGQRVDQGFSKSPGKHRITLLVV